MSVRLTVDTFALDSQLDIRVGDVKELYSAFCWSNMQETFTLRWWTKRFAKATWYILLEDISGDQIICYSLKKLSSQVCLMRKDTGQEPQLCCLHLLKVEHKDNIFFWHHNAI